MSNVRTTATCPACDWRGYGAVDPPSQGAYPCPRRGAVGLALVPVPTLEHCPTCTCTGMTTEGERR